MTSKKILLCRPIDPDRLLKFKEFSDLAKPFLFKSRSQEKGEVHQRVIQLQLCRFFFFFLRTQELDCSVSTRNEIVASQKLNLLRQRIRVNLTRLVSSNVSQQDSMYTCTLFLSYLNCFPSPIESCYLVSYSISNTMSLADFYITSSF